MDGPVLITGISGFIGGRLAARLVEHGLQVRGIDLVAPPLDIAPDVTMFRADLTSPDAVRSAVDGCRLVFHCARWTGRPRTWSAANAIDVHGTANLLDASRAAGVGRVVHISSIVVYGPTRAPTITERTPHDPVGVYGCSKVGAEARARDAARLGLSVVTIRPGQVYGPGARGGTLEPVRWILAGRPAVVDGGLGFIHPIYIEHLIDALLAAASTKGVDGQAFNVADGDVPWRDFYGYYARMCGRRLRSAPSSAAWLAGAIAEVAGWITGRPPSFDRAGVVYLTRRSSYCTALARTRLSWSPRRAMADVMDDTERWLRETGVLPR